MAQQIKKKFIGNDQVDGLKILLLDGQTLRKEDGLGGEIDVIADLEGQISAEETRALAAEGVLQSNIDVEKGRIDAILSGADANLDTFAEVVALINSVDTTNDQAFAGYVLSNDAAVAAIDGRLTTAEGEIDTLQSELAQEIIDRGTLEGEFDAYVISNDAALAQEVSDRTALEGEFDAYVISNDAALAAEVSARTALEGEFDAYVLSNDAAVSALDGRVTTNESDIAQLQSDVAGLGAVVWVNEKFVVDATILSNGFITLANTPISGSIVANVDRLSIFEGASEDFTMSGAVMTFLNELVSPGQQALQVGDEIRVKYQK